MKSRIKKRVKSDKGFVLIVSMIFVVIFAALSVAMVSMCNNNLQIAKNQQKANKALAAALSGIEYARVQCNEFASGLKSAGTISSNQKNAVWRDFRTFMLDHPCNGNCHHCRNYANNGKNVEEFMVPDIDYGAGEFKFSINFIYSDDDPNTVVMQSIGGNGAFSKTITMNFEITRDNGLLKYAVASRGRIWLTSQTVVDGDIFSTWDATRYGTAGIKTTSEVINNGELSVINSIDELDSVNVYMETLDANDNPVFDSNGSRVYSTGDTVQGYHEGINYEQSTSDLAGMNENDYDTSDYSSLCAGNKIPSSSEIITEYFPHVEGDYSGYKSGSKTLNRHVYRNEHFNNAFLSKGRNALFVNCTFEGVLFIEAQSYTSQTSKCNNVRFEDCTFNGVIVTDVPKNSSIKWRENNLYFTGGAIFENEWSSQEATILAPNFNVNLGNTTELELDQSSQLKGAIVGGIVDVRGIVNIDGTIISMYDTKYHSSGYVTNIGSTSEDGGSEGGAFMGENIQISPSAEQLLPQGIKADVILKVLPSTYKEN